MKDSHIIQLHRQAPTKPDYGSRCNGCGVCCAAEPCPAAYIFLRQFSGRCRALLWQETESRYMCGLVLNPKRFIALLPAKLAPSFGRWLASRIAAGAGCDSPAIVLQSHNNKPANKP